MSLSGVRVLDFSRALAGPYCTLMLGELGADVIKVEEPGVGDETREWLPIVNGESGYFFSTNRSKRDIAINLKEPDGQRIARELAAKSDAVVENFAPGVVKRLGIDYETLSAVNPRLIYVSISGFGQTGPYRHKRAYDPILQAMSGIMSVTGPRGGEPVKCGVAITDIFSGMFAAFSIATSLYRRERTGRGQYVDIGILDAALAVTTFQAAFYLVAGEVPGRWGAGHPSVVPNDNYPARDGAYVQLFVNDRRWERFCEVLGARELWEDPVLRSNPGRVAQRERITAVIRERMLTRTADEWLAIFEAEGIPAGPVYTFDKIVADPQVQAREMIRTFEHPRAGTVKAIDMPYKFAEDGSFIRSAPPLLGQHTDEILTDLLGYSPAEVERLKSAGVVE